MIFDPDDRLDVIAERLKRKEYVKDCSLGSVEVCLIGIAADEFSQECPEIYNSIDLTGSDRCLAAAREYLEDMTVEIFRDLCQIQGIENCSPERVADLVDEFSKNCSINLEEV